MHTYILQIGNYLVEWYNFIQSSPVRKSRDSSRISSHHRFPSLNHIYKYSIHQSPSSFCHLWVFPYFANPSFISHFLMLSYTFCLLTCLKKREKKNSHNHVAACHFRISNTAHPHIFSRAMTSKLTGSPSSHLIAPHDTTLLLNHCSLTGVTARPPPSTFIIFRIASSSNPTCVSTVPPAL